MADELTVFPDRVELRGEIATAESPDLGAVDSVNFPGAEDETDLDARMYAELERARAAEQQARQQFETEGPVEFQGRTYTPAERARQTTAETRARLAIYRDRRRSRGEEPFQYLDKARERQQRRASQAKLPFFAGIFAGADKFEQAFPEEQRAAVAERFAGAMDPAREKMQTANLLLVSEMTGKPVEELQKLWPAYRAQYARQVLGWEGAARMVGSEGGAGGGGSMIGASGISDAEFYSLAGKKLAGEQADAATAENIAAKVRAAAISTRPLGEALAEAKAIAGDRWKEFQPAARQAYAQVLADFDDDELATARELFQRTAKQQGAEVETVAGDGTAFLNYAGMTPEKRQRVMNLLALQAQAEGEDVQGYFRRVAAAMGSTVGKIAMGSTSTNARREAELLRKIIDRGTVPEATTGKPVSKWNAEDLWAALVAMDKGATTRPLTDQEKETLGGFAGIAEGQAAFVQDLAGAGIKVSRFMDEKREGFWDSLTDYSLMAAESLPLMALAAIPYGAGLPLAIQTYGEANLAELRKAAPDADPDTLTRTAYAAGALEAGIDRLKWFTMGARVPKLNAKLLQYGKPGALGVALVRAGTVGLAESGQEVVQDLTMPAVQTLASALAEDIPGPDWAEVLGREREALGDILGVSMIFGIIGGAGSTVADVMAAPKLKAALTDRQGLALAGFEAATIDKVATLAETNPAAAAETLKAAVIETPVEVRRANSQAAKEAAEADPAPDPEAAMLPVIEQADGGSFRVRYPDGTADMAMGETDALEAVRMWEAEELDRMDQANRQLARELEASHRENPELAASFKFTGRAVTMQDWAGENRQRIEIARQRVRIAMRQEFLAGESQTDGSAIPDAELPLDAYLILGSSQNFGGAVTRISAEINQRGNVATVLEEHAEGVAKWLMESGKYSRADLVRGIRETEAATGKQTLPDDLDSLGPDGATQAIVEAFSRLAVANAFGKIPESGLSAKFKALFRALKEAFTAIIGLAADIRAVQLSGQMDAQFEYWLDVAGGVSGQYQMDNLQRAEEAELMAAAFEDFPEITATLKGRLPHPSTPGILFPGEIRNIYEGMANNPANGGSKAARTRKANEYFLPVGEKVDLDEVREHANEKGFGFDTPADMLEALDLSVNYGRPQYGTGAEMDFEPGTFSVATGPFPAADTSFSIGLASIHNLSAENLEFADRMGGLAVPSIAVVPAGQPIRGFGEITLVGGLSVADPAENPVFDADAYTARFPSPEWKKVPMKIAQKVVDRFRPFTTRFGDQGTTDAIWDKAVNRPDPESAISYLKRSVAAKAAFLGLEEGIELEPVMRPAKLETSFIETPSFQRYMEAGGPVNPDSNDSAGLKKLGAATAEAIREFYNRPAFALRQEMVENLVEGYVNEQGEIRFGSMMAINRDLKKLGTEEIDQKATIERVDAALQGKEAAFYQWIEGTIRAMHDAPRLKVRGKMVPYTLENIVEAMTTGRTAGAEKTMTFSEGQIRATNARRFRRLEEMRTAAAGMIRTEDEVDALRKDLSKRLGDWREALMGFYKWKSAWEALDNSMAALGKFLKGSRTPARMAASLRSMDFEGVPQDLIEEAIRIGEAFMEAPVPYFEAKPQRVVRLDEFKAAVIPETASAATLEILAKHGIQIQTVPAGESLEARAEALGKLIDGGGLSFSIAPSRLRVKPPKGVKAIRTDSLPVWDIEQDKDTSLPKNALETAAGRARFFSRLDRALEYLREEPARITTGPGWVKFLRMAGIYGEVPMPPSGLAEIINDPAAYVAKLNGGYHGERTIDATQESARQGLDGTREMREIIGEGQAPAPWAVALHHLWGVLSRMLPPLQQEAMWLRLIAHRPVLDAIQSSIDGTFDLELAEWKQLVSDAREATAEDAGQVGNAATANANSFFLMLRALNGRWQDVADVYAAPNSREMGRRFWSLDAGALGIKNKVQRFIGLTFGVPGVIMDRWKFVEFWLPTAMEGTGAETPSEFFNYGGNTPSDPTGIYGVYGGVDAENTALSLAMYEAFEVVLQEAINKSPELQGHLGAHANPGGMHWHGWNAIKNEAVGHSSLDLTKDLQRAFGVAITAEDVQNTVRNGSYFTEGAETQRSNLKVTLDRGKIRVERSGVAGGLQPGDPGLFGQGTGRRSGRGGQEIAQAAEVGSRSFSAVRATSPLLAAIDSLARSPEATAKVFQGMRAKVGEVRDRMDESRRKSGFSEDDLDPDRFEKLRDLATLEAIAKALPAPIRGKFIGSFRDLEELKTSKGREKYLIALLPKVEQAVEAHLVDQYRAAIRREMVRGAVKVAESKTRGGKIGATAHMIFDEAKAAMTLDPDAAETAAAKIQEQIEGADSLSMDQLAELDARLAAIELFHDYQNATSTRLEQGLELLKATYREGRAAWLEVLMERRLLRDQRVLTIQRGLGMTYRDGDGIERPVMITDAMRTRAVQKDKTTARKLSEGFMAAFLSGSQKLRRLGELTEDAEVRRVVEGMEDAFAGAEALETDLNLADNAELAEAMRKILGVSTDYALAKKLRELSEATEAAPVEKIEGRKKELITVPINIVESLLARETGGFTAENGKRIDLDEFDREALQEQWDRFQELQEEDQGRKRTLTFARLIAAGKRQSIGNVSQLEGLQLYLTMRQPDQARKLERMGYDETTMAELMAWLKPEVRALGAWMVGKLAAEQGAVDALHRAEKGVGLRLVDNYFPVRNDVSRADTGGLSLDGGQQQQTGRSVGFIKERVANNAPPAYVNALAVFLAHRAQSNFWKSHVTPLREWGGLLRDERFSTAVKVRMGSGYYQSLTRLLERIEAGGALAAQQQMAFERWIRGMMRNFSLGTLGMRVSTLMVNTTAALNAGLEIPAKDLVKGMLLAARRPEAFRDAWNSPVIRRRLAEGSSAEAKLAKSAGPSTSPILAQLQAYAEKGVAPINYVDTAANLLGAASVWEYTRTQAVAAGMPDADARAEADAAVERVFRRAAQPTARLSRSELELRALDNPLSALLSLFISEPRKNLAIAFAAGRELLTGKGTYGKAQAAQQIAVSMVVMVAAEYVMRSLYAALAKAEDDDEGGVFARWWDKLTDAKAWGHHLATGHLKSIPLAGEAWNQAMGAAFDQKTFDASPNPLNKLAKSGKVIAEMFDDQATARDAVEGGIDIVQWTGSAMPGGPLFAQLANVADFGTSFATSNGVDFTPADRRARIKGQWRAFEKELEELHGKTTGDDGKVRKDIQDKKAAARADWLRSRLAPLPADEREKLLEELKPAKSVRELMD